MILHTARMRPSQKAALGVFLCRSLVMVIFSITRVSKISGASGVDVPWVFFWQFAEASIAVLMGSLTVFRTLLIAERKTGPRGSPGAQLGKGSPAAGCGGKRPRSYYALHHRIRLLAAGRSTKGDLESQEGLPEIPGAMMTGLRTFIRRNNRDSAMGTAVVMTAISQHSTIADGADEESLRKVKEKEEKVGQVGVEEMRQVMTPTSLRNAPAYHYPVCSVILVDEGMLTGVLVQQIWRPQPSQVQPSAHPDSVWTGPSTQASQTSIGGTTIHEMSGP